MTVTCATETVTFKDGSSLVVAEENWLTGVKLLRLQKQAEGNLPADMKELERIYFHIDTYPKLCAAIVEGTPPPENDAIMMPSTEIDKWYQAVRKLNPHWFVEVPDEKDKTSETKKKNKPRKRK